MCNNSSERKDTVRAKRLIVFENITPPTPNLFNSVNIRKYEIKTYLLKHAVLVRLYKSFSSLTMLSSLTEVSVHLCFRVVLSQY